MPPQSASAATPAPAPTVPEPATTTEAGPRPATYTLQAGDTLESVGKQWGLTGRQLQRYNKLTNKQVRRLQIGTVIKVPPATK
jgi:LysM repeat protein